MIITPNQTKKKIPHVYDPKQEHLLTNETICQKAHKLRIFWASN